MDKILFERQNFRIYWYRATLPKLRILIVEITDVWTWKEGTKLVDEANRILSEAEKPVYSIFNFTTPETSRPKDALHLNHIGKLIDSDPLHEEFVFFTGYAGALIRILIDIYLSTQKLTKHTAKYRYCHTLSDAVQEIKNHQNPIFTNSISSKKRITLQNLPIQVVLLLSLLASISLIISGLAHALQANKGWLEWIESAFQNLGTELIGAIITFIVIGVFVEMRRNQDNLLEQIRTGDSNTSVNALKRLLVKGVNLDQKNMRDANFHNADLTGMDLSNLDLRGARFSHAKLQGVKFNNTNMGKADLSESNLTNGNLKGVILEQANLEKAKLDEAYMVGANLAGADLQGASLRNAYLAHVNFDKTVLIDAVLPDDVIWTERTDITKYTDPTHPKFWTPDWIH